MICALILIALIIGLSLSFAFSNRYYTNVKQRSLKEVYERVDRLYQGIASDSSGLLTEDAYSKLSLLCEEQTISLLVMTPSGKVDFSFGNYNSLYSRLNDLMLSRDTQSSQRVIEKEDNYVLQSYNEGRNSNGHIEIWGFLSNGNFLIARSSYAGISNSVSVSFVFFGLVCGIVFLMLGFFSIMIIKPYTDSLNRLLIFAQKANKGEFEVEYEEPKRNQNDEIGMLGENISEMSRKLERTISELKTSNLKLENELKTKIKQEEARKKYMSDVSHELKTPIALISGYAEGLKEGISDNPEDRDYYCEVIIDEAEKMNNMIKKLATLNQLEHGASQVSLERFDVVQVIDGFLNAMAIVIEEQGAHVHFNNKNSVYVWSDEFLVEEVLTNYFNNALHHLNEEKIIRISVDYTDESNVRITVYNSGNSIPEEEQDKIWGQFYKVDKARTRAYGGSGLGLSIVKAVADSLGKKCGVKNEEGGVAFWIDLEGDAGNGSN